MNWEDIIRREIKEEKIQKEYEKVKEEYRKIISIEESILSQYGGEIKMFNTLLPKIKPIIEEKIKNNENYISKVELFTKLGFFDEGVIEKYKLEAYTNLMDKIIKKMGYSQNEKITLIYTFNLNID